MEISTHGVRDRKIVIQCENCKELLYNTNLTFANIGGRTSDAKDFMPIGAQPEIINGMEAPPCWKCGEKWIWYSKRGLEMMTTQGRFLDKADY